MGKGKHANTLRRQCSLAALLLAAGSAAAEQVGERWRANGSRNNGTERAAQAEVVARFEGQHGRMPMGWQIQSRDIYSSEIRVLYVPVPVPARIDPWYFRFGDELFLNEAEMNDYIVERTPGDEGCRPTRGAGIEWHQGDLDTQWRAMQEPGSLRLLVTKRDKQTDECLTRPQYASVERKRGVHCLPPLLTDDMLQMCALRRPQDDFALYYFGPLSQRNCDGVGNPCNPSTGDKFQREIDLDLPWMRWTRNYHSLQPTMEAPFGPGWSHDHNVRLVLDGNGMPVGLVDDDGSQRSLPLSLYTNDDSGDRVRVLRDGWELLRSDERVEFNRRGQLRARYFNDGRVLLYEYSRSGRLVIIGDGTGREVEIGYDARGRINRVLQDGHQLLGYRYQQGRLVAVVHADATQRTYHYEDERHPDHLTGITAEDGRRFGWYAYDDKGRVVCSQHSAGCDDDIPGLDGVRLAYPDDGTTIVRDALGRRSVYHWEQLNGQNAKRLVALVDDGGTQRRRYERPGLLAEVVDRRGTSTSYRRTETAGQRTLTVVEAEYTSAERLATYHTDKQTNRLLQSIQTGRDTRYTYNARLQPVQIVEQGQSGGAQRVIRIEYCETNAPACGHVGQMRSVTFAPGSTTRYAYYTADAAGCSVSAFTCSHRRGDLHTVTNAAGLSITHEAYDASGRVLRERDANGVLTEREWHPRGWLSRVTVHGSMPEQNRTTRFNWTPLGDLQQVIEPGGHTLTWIYNNARHLTDIVSSEGSSISYTLDLQGNRTGEAITDAQGTLRHALARTFDLMGNVTASLDAYGHVIRYATDAEGNTVSLTDALGRVTRLERDPLARVIRQTQGAGRQQAVIRTTYTADDEVSQITDPKGLRTVYTRDAFGDLTALQSPDTGTSVVQRDAQGRISQRTDARGVTTRYEYDGLGRMVSGARGLPAEDHHYRYDNASPHCSAEERFGAGHLSEAIHARGSTIYCYTPFGEVASKLQTIDGQALRLRYRYDEGGRLVTMQLPDASRVHYQRDPQGRISGIRLQRPAAAVETVLRDVGYAPFGPATGWTYGNGRRLQRTLDQNYRVTALHDERPDGLQLDLGFDAAGQLTQLRSASAPAGEQRYGYDALGRLISVNRADGSPLQQYALDTTGNRTMAADAAGSRAYHYSRSNHRLQSDGLITRHYDSNGNTVELADLSFTYSDANRMVAVARGGQVLERYHYNALGERVLREPTDGAAVRTLYDERGRWLGDYRADGSPVQQAIWLDDLPVALLTTTAAGLPSLAYIEPDHLGTPRVVIDSDRDVALWRWPLEKDAFGAHAPEDDVDGDGIAFELNLRHPGQQYTAASGLYYNYYRDLDASIGRYVQSDPIGLSGGISTYGYVAGRPLALVDPKGLEGVGPWTYPAGKMRDSFSLPPIQARAPDYVRVQLSLYVFGVNRTFSRSGNTFVGGNIARSYPPTGKAQVSISAGWLNSCSVPDAADVDKHLEGFGMAGGGGYYGIGGAVNWSPTEQSFSTELGFGIGAGVSPGGISKPGEQKWGDGW